MQKELSSRQGVIPRYLLSKQVCSREQSPHSLFPGLNEHDPAEVKRLSVQRLCIWSIQLQILSWELKCHLVSSWYYAVCLYLAKTVKSLVVLTFFLLLAQQVGPESQQMPELDCYHGWNQSCWSNNCAVLAGLCSLAEENVSSLRAGNWAGKEHCLVTFLSSLYLFVLMLLPYIPLLSFPVLPAVNAIWVTEEMEYSLEVERENPPTDVIITSWSSGP